MAMIAPCPRCFGAVVAAIILVSPLIGATSFAIGQYAAISLKLTIALFYALSDVIVWLTKKPYPVLLGNFMLFVGLYFLASAIVLPNISTVLQSPMSPLNLPSTNEIIYVTVLVVLLVIVGCFLTAETVY